MCCIFTLCGWVIDLIQRLWTFTMSCCISSAVCCACVTAAMAGVALGYNYSLAEYIDLKETNVSVFLKRGVFDDDVVDDLDWRRQGGGGPPTAASERSVGQRPPQDDFDAGRRSEDSDGSMFRTGTPIVRRLDDSIIESNDRDRDRFEGSLLRLTATPLFATTPTPDVAVMKEIGEAYSTLAIGSPDSLDQMKELEGLRRKAIAAVKAVTQFPTKSTRMSFPQVEEDSWKDPDAGPQTARRMIPPIQPDVTTVNSLRFAVPGPLQRFDWYTVDPGAGHRFMEEKNPLWFVRKMPHYSPQDRNPIPTKPYYPGDVEYLRQKATKPPPTTTPHMPIIVETYPESLIESTSHTKRPTIFPSEIKSFEENLKESDIIKTLNEPEGKDYDDEDIKGLPVRRRRSIEKPGDVTIRYESFTSGPDIQNHKKHNNENENSLYDKFLAVFRNVDSIIFGKNSKSFKISDHDDVNKSTTLNASVSASQVARGLKKSDVKTPVVSRLSKSLFVS